MRLRAFACIALAAPFAAARPQSAGDLSAFVALRASHLGALTPLMTPAMLGRHLNGAALALRYGLRDESGVRTQGVAGSGVFSVGLQSSFVVTAGVSDADCAGCSPAMMLGAGGDMRILEAGDAVGTGSSLSLSVSGDVGYAQVKPGDRSAFTLGVGAPVALTLGDHSESGLRFTPYFVPMFGIGQLSGSCVAGFGACERNGVRWVLGGGIGVWNPTSSVSASIGINQVVLTDARPVFGVNVAIGGR